MAEKDSEKSEDASTPRRSHLSLASMLCSLEKHASLGKPSMPNSPRSVQAAAHEHSISVRIAIFEKTATSTALHEKTTKNAHSKTAGTTNLSRIGIRMPASF